MRIITTKYDGTCADCGSDLPTGTDARYYGYGRLYGITCHEDGETKAPKAPKAPRTRTKAHQWEIALDKAHKAGMVAVEATTPTPMVVEQHRNQFDDDSPVVKQWLVPGGVCGFANVTVKPGTHSFAKWATKHGHGRRDNYAGGISLSLKPEVKGTLYQSYEIVCAYANAAAAELLRHGVPASVWSRID
jgi:hypothetical protein